ncbi:MAG: hypothetical protein LBV51_02375 [Acholeplasmatales bacterium]|jgi:hypothetical protein|nr:hypothetical protein [Acholeplasmatales bacterium]
MQDNQENYIYDPDEKYKNEYKQLFLKNCTAFFDDLVKNSNIDVEKNIYTNKKITEYISIVDKLDNMNDKLKSNSKFLLTLIILFSIGIFLDVVIFVLSSESFVLVFILLLVFFISGIVGFSLIRNITIKNKMATTSYEHGVSSGILNDLKKEAADQLVPLNALYKWGMTKKIIEQTVPIIKLNDIFDIKMYDYLKSKYYLDTFIENDKTITQILSGNIIDNPFVIVKTLIKTMGTKTYYGSITVTWTSCHTDSKGNTVYTQNSQVLSASVTEPCPYYTNGSYVVYANESAPNLTFTKLPSNAPLMSDKKLEHFVKKEEKAINNIARKGVGTASNFTPTGNPKFDAVFKTTSRNNEIEYRLLFTPLSQTAMVNLILNNWDIYKPDFYFRKDKMLNYIKFETLEKIDLVDAPKKFKSSSVLESKNKFISYNTTYFKLLYYCLAPLLTIPLYQHQRPQEYKYSTKYKCNISPWEREALGNYAIRRFKKLSESDTYCINKTKITSKDDTTDIIEITSYGFTTEKMVTHFTKMANDGNYHDIPVYWTKYNPIENTFKIRVITVITDNDISTNKNNLNAFLYKGTLCEILND